MILKSAFKFQQYLYGFAERLDVNASIILQVLAVSNLQ